MTSTHASNSLGIKSRIWYGTTGTTASIRLYNTRDISIAVENSEVDMTDRDDDWDDTDVVSAGLQFSFTLMKKTTNKTARGFLLQKITTIPRSPIALKIQDSDTGTIWDADFILSLDESHPHKDSQQMNITAKRTGKSGRGVTVTFET